MSARIGRHWRAVITEYEMKTDLQLTLITRREYGQKWKSKMERKREEGELKEERGRSGRIERGMRIRKLERNRKERKLKKNLKNK